MITLLNSYHRLGNEKCFKQYKPAACLVG